MKSTINVNPTLISLDAEDIRLADINNKITATELEGAVLELYNKTQNHVDSTTSHPAQNITYSGNVTGATQVKQAIDSVQSQVNAITVEGSIDPQVSQALVDINNVTHSSLKERLDTWDKKKVFWREEKTILAGSNSFTLTNTVQSYMTLEIRDKKYNVFWEKDIHWTISGQVVTLTETALIEDLTFVIKAI